MRGEPSLDDRDDGCPHPRGPQEYDAVREAGKIKGVHPAHEQKSRPEDEGAERYHQARAEAVRQVSCQGREENVGEQIGVVDGPGIRPAETQVPDHFRQDNTVAQPGGVIDEQVGKADSENDPGQVKGRTRFHACSPGTVLSTVKFFEKSGHVFAQGLHGL